MALLLAVKWGARPANCSEPLKHTLPEYVIIIHTAGSECFTPADCSEQMRNIQDYHLFTKKWCDMSYNFLIGEDGNLYEGRGWRNAGAHTFGYNDLSLGIAFMGNFLDKSPNEAAWNVLKCLLDFAVKMGYLAEDYLILAHNDVSNLLSPGEPIRREISKWPNYKHN
ncbi:hypothetical protein lerEdw1_015818 [Lerista edwardsae]|nr:hypothetical protein lerEdw1_015818 [Lerista edwardsae]